MKNLKVRKNIKALALSSSLALLSLTGCEEKGNDCTVREYMQSVDEFNLINPDKRADYKIIETENAKGETDVNFVQVLTGGELTDVNIDTWVFEDSEDYTKYGNGSGAYYYIDALDGDLISVKQEQVDKHLFKDNEYETSYLISTITNEDNAYNYACTYLGDKETYTREDMNDLVELIQDATAKEATDNPLSLK